MMRINFILCLLAFSAVLQAQKMTIMAENIYRYAISPKGELNSSKRSAIEQKTFDMQGRLIQQVFYNDTIPTNVDRYSFFFYDSLKLISKETHGPDYSLRKVKRYIYDQEGKLSETKTYQIDSNKKAEPVSKTIYSDYHDTVPRSIVTYNSGGKWIKKTMVDFRNGNKIRLSKFKKGENSDQLKQEIRTYTYLNGKINKEKVVEKYYGKKPLKETIINYSYGKNPLRLKPLKKTFTDDNGTLLETKIYRYTPDGFLDFEKTLNPKGLYISFIKSEHFKHEIILLKKREMFPINH